MTFAFQYPIFFFEIQCPHCRQTIPALTLTDTYLCSRHGAFEADPHTSEWYRQHTHPDGIRFEIHDALEKLHDRGYRATKVIIAERYRDLIGGYLDSPGAALLREHHHPWMSDLEQSTPRLFGPNDEPCWQVINFDLEKEPGMPVQYPFRMSL